ncbi:YciI family protein [Nocardioides sp.]|uniref:YciI family protein n=1 Tax=Nocardioides sp. TaxID=35761 RepID=UPI0025D908C0|nr:YciI family protein [Nocardioides sp.]
MRYITFVKMAEGLEDPPLALQEAMAKEMDQAIAAGTMLEAGGLSGMRDSTEIHLRSGTITQVDGPYAEGKEVAGGYAITEVRSHEEAVEGARRVLELHQQYWPGWEGSVEIRQMFTAPGQ